MASSVNNLVVSFLEAGHSVYVFTLSNEPKSKKYVGENITLYVVATGSKTTFGRSFPSLNRLATKLIPCIRKEFGNIDVLHAQWCYEYALAAKAFEKEIPVF